MRFRRIAAATAIALIFAVALAGCGKGGQKKLMSYFPDKEGYTWEYEGTDGYAHNMTLDTIYEDSSLRSNLHDYWRSSSAGRRRGTGRRLGRL